jgi:hypothetical protein
VGCNRASKLLLSEAALYLAKALHVLPRASIRLLQSISSYTRAGKEYLDCKHTHIRWTCHLHFGRSVGCRSQCISQADKAYLKVQGLITFRIYCNPPAHWPFPLCGALCNTCLWHRPMVSAHTIEYCDIHLP